MTDAPPAKVSLGRFGVWTRGPLTPELAAEIEGLGFGTVWVGGSPDAGLRFVDDALAQTQSIVVATGVVNVWSAAARTAAESYHRIEREHPGRFVLGIGVGHREHAAAYAKPYEALSTYLDELDAAGVPRYRRVLAALSPRLLRLAAERTAGALPALTTPQHTRDARRLLGGQGILAPAVDVVLSTNPDIVYLTTRAVVTRYATIANFANSWERQGFTAADLTAPGSQRLVDAVFASGGADDIVRRLDEHLDAGADHVAIHVANESEALMETLTELADGLKLRTQQGHV
jgi:probable F420-dependent oxidoreductase